jgi:glucose-1-phosphate adenylyltransferase
LINDACISRSVLSPFVTVDTNASVKESILMKGVTVGHHAKVRRAIIDEGISIPPHYTIGFDSKKDKKSFSMTESGIVVVPQGCIID